MSWNRKRNEKARLKRLADNGGKAWYNEEKGCWVRYYYSGRKWNRYTHLKKEANRRVRRTPGAYSHMMYKNIFDLPWIYD